MVRRPLVLSLTLLSLVLTGCALDEPPAAVATPTDAPEPVAPTPSPAASPSPLTPAPLRAISPILLVDEFEGARIARPWSAGYWDANAQIGGHAQLMQGALRLRVGGPEEGYAIGRPIAVDQEVHEIVATARVEPVSLERYGIYLKTARGDWVGLEVDHEGFCLCANRPNDPYVDMAFVPPRPGEIYEVTLAVDADGVARIRVEDDAGRVVASRGPTQLRVPADDVTSAWIGVWRDDGAQAPGDYLTHRIEITQNVATG